MQKRLGTRPTRVECCNGTKPGLRPETATELPALRAGSGTPAVGFGVASESHRPERPATRAQGKRATLATEMLVVRRRQGVAISAR